MQPIRRLGVRVLLVHAMSVKSGGRRLSCSYSARRGSTIGPLCCDSPIKSKTRLRPTPSLVAHNCRHVKNELKMIQAWNNIWTITSCCIVHTYSSSVTKSKINYAVLTWMTTCERNIRAIINDNSETVMRIRNSWFWLDEIKIRPFLWLQYTAHF